MSLSIDALNRQFGLANTLHFSESGRGLPVIEIQCPLATARIALQGAHVLAWQPAGQAPVLWVSKAAIFEPGQAIRGGVPLCWPWFGPLPGQSLHGFVRTRLWQVRSTRVDAAGQVVVRLGIADDASTRAIWDFAFDLELVVTVGQTLTMALSTRNTGESALDLAQALHTYFSVGDIRQTRVLGLENTEYIDKVNQMALTPQTGAVTFSGETDRIYINTRSDCVIDDQAQGRRIRIAKQGSASTVVWNPWSEKVFADMGPGEYLGMVCVETCNAGPDRVSVAPGASHVLSATISVE